jgi:hypothetical protein
MVCGNLGYQRFGLSEYDEVLRCQSEAWQLIGVGVLIPGRRDAGGGASGKAVSLTDGIGAW